MANDRRLRVSEKRPVSIGTKSRGMATFLPKDLKLKRCRAFWMESALSDSIGIICLNEAITYDDFVSSVVRIGITEYFRQQYHALQVACVLDPSQPASDTRRFQVLSLANDEVAVPTALHVLIVDDVSMIREMASSFLRAAGHKITCVECGVEAVAAVEATDFDVVLMDVLMPEMDGLEAARRIRALGGERSRVPIVAVTARAFPEQIAEYYEAGMDHIPKPFDPDSLQAGVLRAATQPRFATAFPPFGHT